jgi:hypothetical protein
VQASFNKVSVAHDYAPSERGAVMLVFRRGALVVLAVLALAIAFASSAFAAVNYVYFNDPTTPNGTGGGDVTVYYRNYNNSCSGDGFAWTKSIYSLGNGSWVAVLEGYSGCGWNNTHLGPSSNYGHTYVQSKCRNVHGNMIWLRCETTRPG